MSYRTPHPRRANNAIKAHAEPANPKVSQLQELFPSWSDDGTLLSSLFVRANASKSYAILALPDLKSVLTEVNFDIELAVTRISEGNSFLL